MTSTSIWSTNKKYGWARRAAGDLTVVLHRGAYWLLHGEAQELVDAPSLELAMEKADSLHPPPGWEYVFGLWLGEGWKITKEDSHWKIYDQNGELKSTQNFERSDIARKWCEVRQDRVGMNLRGPKPKQA